MKKVRHTDSQIISILKQNESGTSVAELCREHDMSQASFYKWRSKYGGMDMSLMKRMKALEDENRRLKRMYAEIADCLLRLTTANKRWGFGLCFLYLRNIKGFVWNYKRVYRIYRECELNLRIKAKRGIKRDKPEALGVPTEINQVWSIDFMSDSLHDGRALEQIIEWRGKPKAIRCDNGPEYISQTRVDWSNKHQITLLYIQSGKPTQNAYIERFNRTARHEWLDLHLFESVEHAQLLATQWFWLYNNQRPHSEIGGVPPRKLLDVA